MLQSKTPYSLYYFTRTRIHAHVKLTIQQYEKQLFSPTLCATPTAC